MFGLNDEEFTSLIFNIDVSEESEENEENEENECMDRYGNIYTWDEINSMQSTLIKSNINDNEELPF